MSKLSTPASSQAPRRAFIQRCRVLRRTEALPGKGRLVAVLTPYSIVGARRISRAPERSSARRSTMMVSQPSGRCGPCCSHVPTGTRRRASRSRMKRTSSGTRVLRCSGVLMSRSPRVSRPSPPPSGCTGARRPGRGRRVRRGGALLVSPPRRSPRAPPAATPGPPAAPLLANGAARRHHTILRVARGPAPDAGRRECGGERVARHGTGGAGPRRRGQRTVRGRLRRGTALLYAGSRTTHGRGLRLLPDRLRAWRYSVQRPAGAAGPGRREARRTARRDAAHGGRAGRRAAARVSRRAAGPLALVRRARGRVVRGPRADRLLHAHGRPVLARRVLSPRARRVQRLGRGAHGPGRGGTLRCERPVAARARATLVERRGRGRARSYGAVPGALSRPRHRAAGGRRRLRVMDFVGGRGRYRSDGAGARRSGIGTRPQ